MDYGGFWRAKDERIGDFDVRVRVGFGRVSVRYGRVRIGFGRVRVRFGRVLGFIQGYRYDWEDYASELGCFGGFATIR